LTLKPLTLEPIDPNQSMKAAADKQLHLASWQDAYTSREEKLYHNDAREKYLWLVEKYVASIAAN